MERAIEQRQRDRDRAAVFAAYGDRCAAPGCLTPDRDLTIDHVDGRGAEHRADNRISGSTSFYRWLVRNNFPPGFQVLCRGCNSSKGRRPAAGVIAEPRRQITLF